MKISSFRKQPSNSWQRTLFIMFFAQLITAVGFSSIFPFLPLYVETLGSRSGLSVELMAGLVFSAQAFTMMLASPIWGMLADRLGRKLMVVRAMFGGSVLLLLMAFVRSGEELVLLRAAQGMITGTVAAANALVAAVVPRQRTGYAMGLLQVGLGSGIAFGPMLGGAIADAYGYGATFYVTSALLLLAGITVLVGVEEDFRPSEHNQDGRDGFLSQWRALFRTPGVAMTYGMRFVTQLGRMMIIPITPLFVQRLLSDSARVNTFTGLVIGVSAGATTISSIYLGRLGDQIGQRRIVIISSLIAALLYLPQSLVTQGWHLLVLLALVGVAMGGIIPAISALLASYTHPGEEGAVYGMDNSVRAAARSLAPLLGSGVALWFGLRGTFVATAVFFVLAWALALWRLPEPGDILKLPAMRTRTRHW